MAVFRGNVTASQQDAHLATIGETFNITASFRVGKFAAFVAFVTDVESLEVLHASEMIDYVERDIPLRLKKSKCDVEKSPSWGLCRTSQTKLPLDGTYKYETSPPCHYHYHCCYCKVP
jgi:hypothetical protein